jgi:hypothetical protein
MEGQMTYYSSVNGSLTSVQRIAGSEALANPFEKNVGIKVSA